MEKVNQFQIECEAILGEKLAASGFEVDRRTVGDWAARDITLHVGDIEIYIWDEEIGFIAGSFETSREMYKPLTPRRLTESLWPDLEFYLTHPEVREARWLYTLKKAIKSIFAPR